MTKQYLTNLGEYDPTTGAGSVYPLLDGDDIVTLNFVSQPVGGTLTFTNLASGTLGAGFRGVITHIFVDSEDPTEGWAQVTVAGTSMMEFHIPGGAVVATTPLDYSEDSPIAEVAATDTVIINVMSNATSSATFSGCLVMRREPTFANVDTD